MGRRPSERDSETTTVFDFSRYKIFDIDGIGRIELEGELSADSLATLLVENWIPYFECDHCGRKDYCRYTIPHPHRVGRLRDIRCGVVADALTKYVRHTFALLQDMSPDQVQSYLDGSFHLEQFLHDAELSIGLLITDSYLDWLGEFVPSFYGRLTQLREHLNKASSEFQQIKEFRSQKGILFVEGWAEYAFLEKLRESRTSWFTDLKVEVYDGKANKKPNRIQMLLDRYVADGYEIYIQGDADGRETDIFARLVDTGFVSTDHTFTFAHDFESAIPADLLYLALVRLGELEAVGRDKFCAAVRMTKQPIAQVLDRCFGLDISRQKKELATTVAAILNESRRPWIQSEQFRQTELGQFLMFVVSIP